jgi:Helicase conserved C-terminal domain
LDIRGLSTSLKVMVAFVVAGLTRLFAFPTTIERGSCVRSRVPSVARATRLRPIAAATPSGLAFGDPAAPAHTRVSAPAPPSPPPPISAAAEIAAAVAAGRDVLVLGRGRQGRIAGALAGARARHARAVLILVPRFAAIEPAARDARQAYPEARVVSVLNAALRDDVVPAGNPGRVASKSGVCVVVGTMIPVGDAFLRDQQGKNWLHTVELIVLYDVRALSDPEYVRMMHKLVRMVTVNTALVVAIADSIELLPPKCIVPSVLRSGYQSIDWFDNVNVVSDAKSVQQRYAVVHPRRLIPALTEIMNDSFANTSEQCKVIVFFPTARLTQFFAEVMSLLGLNLCEVHSAKTEAHRISALEDFHAHSRTCLFTSDAVWRGADLENVTRVIQVGLARNAVQYSKRVCQVSPGGSSLTILCDYEVDAFLASDCMTVQSPAVAASLQVQGLGGDRILKTLGESIDEARRSLEDRIVLNAYASWLACHKSNMIRLGWTERMLVRRAWQWARAVAGLERPPVLPLRMAEKLQLVGVPGIEVDTGPDQEELRKTDLRQPDIHGKFKKRKPMGRWYYSSRYLVNGE